MNSVSLSLTKNPEESSWLEAVLRAAKPYGLEDEILWSYDKYIKEGDSDEDAAYGAASDWDVLEFRE